MKSSVPVPQRNRKVFHRVLLVAASLAVILALTIVPVLGYRNVIIMVAHLANGTFRFVPDNEPGSYGSSSIAQLDGTYETLPEALEAYGIHEQVFPQILAEEFEQIEFEVEELSFSHKIEYGYPFSSAKEKSGLWDI